MGPVPTDGGIEVLEDAWHAIRARPALYVGPLRTEAAAGAIVVGAGCLPLFACGLREVKFSVTDGIVALEFDGDPSPLVERYAPAEPETAVETFLRKLHACRDRHVLDDIHGSSFCQGGVSLAVINALSHWVEVELHDGAQRWVHRRVEGASDVPIHASGESVGRRGCFRFAPMSQVVEPGHLRSVGWPQLRDAFARETPTVRVVEA